MSDASTKTALRSDARLVVIESPAGCGKTFHGAEYAREIAGRINGGRVLILTHTHAACDVFASRTRRTATRVDIRTIDSLIAQIASAYHTSLGLPGDTGAWARQNNGYAVLAARVAALLRASAMIGQSLAERYPIVICDEHQDASAEQHSVAMACHKAGASVRVFGDPMQRIYGRSANSLIEADNRRWEELKRDADIYEELDEPHRWADGSDSLGRWILEARDALREGGKVNLRHSLPPSVSVIVAENRSPKPGGYQLTSAEGKPIYDLVNSMKSLLVLASYNETVRNLRAFFGRSLPIWEGHTRENLSGLIGLVQKDRGNAACIASALVTFLNGVATGFSASAYGNTLLAEVTEGCVAKRSGKPAKLQALGRLILDQPNHEGVANVLRKLNELIATDPSFENVKLDHRQEFWDAIRIGQFDDPYEGFAELSRRRSYARPALPPKAISTIHKAKGLECSDVLVMPCDAKHFGNSFAPRCRLYVAMSRATRSLTFVVSRENPSPLIML